MTRPTHIRLTFALLLAALVVSPHVGSAQADRRIVEVRYHADRIVPVYGQTGIQTMIEFSQDERIENIALGDSAAWQVTPNKRANLLFLKPLAARAHTNMTVVTDQRRYLFDLVSISGRARPVYLLRFAYPELLQLVPATGSAGIGGTEAGSSLAAGPAPAAAAPAPARNTAWRVTGARQLQPLSVSDDGLSTYLSWNPANDLPAILAVEADGHEGPVNFTVHDGTIVIDGVAQRYVLRIGKAAASLVRLAPLDPPIVAKAKDSAP